MKESIVRQVLLLICVFFLNMTIIILVHSYMNRRVEFLQKLTENELVKVELSYLSHEKLQSLRGLFQDLFLSRSSGELELIEQVIDQKTDELSAILGVIEHGGEVSHQYEVNFGGKENITRKFVYKNYYPNRISLEVIEIRAKIVELKNFSTNFQKLMMIAISQKNLQDASSQSEYREVLLYYKRIAPFFDRLMENSYRIYFDAQTEMLKLGKVQDSVEETFSRRVAIAMTLIAFFVFILAWVIIRNITVIIKEREASRAALQASHETLEMAVLERTSELEQEIAVRQDAEAEQRKQAEFLKTVIDSLSHPFYVLDVETYEIQMLNKAAYKLGPENASFCYALTHKRDSPCSGDDHPCPVAEVLLTKQPVTMEHIHFDQYGNQIFVEVHGYPIFDGDGKLCQMIEYSLDITEKKIAEMKLEENNKNLEKLIGKRTRLLEEEIVQREKLQLVVEQNPSSIVITDLEGKIEYVNKQFEKVTGYTRSEVLGENPRILNSGQTPSEVYVDMWETLKREEVWNGEFVNQSKDKQIYHENVIVAPLKNDKGEVTHYVAIKENITELKKAQKAAEASNIAKSKFLSRMSHELRTPLNAINGFSQLLLRNNNKHTLDERQTQQVLNINNAGLHLLELINEILDLSRIESGHLTLSLEPVVVADTVNECVILITSLAEKTEVTVKLDPGIDELPLMQADLTRLKQVMLNLLSNGIKYNRPKGHVSIAGKMEGDKVCLEISDNGIGISKEKMKDLFVPFTRLGQDETGIEGTGIGMTITKQLVELMHGSLEVESEVGVGSVFTVKIPRAKEEVAEGGLDLDGSMREQEGLVKQKATLLYIEDNPGNIKYMRDIVEQWPWLSLVVRKNAEKGIKAAVMLKPDLIFMDLHLPGMSGQEAFAELKKKTETKDIPVIALSADAQPSTKKDCLAMGFVSYITKPVEIGTLQTGIEKYLHS